MTRSTLSRGALLESHSSAPALAKPVYVRSVAATYLHGFLPFFEDSITQREGARGPRGAKFAHTWTHTQARRLAERGEAPKSARARGSSKAARQSVSFRRSPALAGRNQSPAIILREGERERERHRAPSYAIIEPALLAARIGPPAPHLRHRRQPGRRSDNPTGEAAPTSYGYSDDTSGIEARVGKRIEAEAPSAAAD